jgi:HSP20 family protein
MFWSEIKSPTLSQFEGVRNLQGEINRLFENYADWREEFPPVNIWSNNEELILKAEVPGVDPKDISIDLNGDQLLISGERKADVPSEGVTCHHSERSVGSFSRSFRLPYEIDSAKVTAKSSNGVLTVVLPRAEYAKPRKINVQSE